MRSLNSSRGTSTFRTAEIGLRELRDHAIASVQQMLKEWSVETISELRSLVADKLSVKIEYISEDMDTECLAEKYGQVMGGFRQLLRAEFIKSDTEGLLIDNPKPGKGGRDYLVIVDARGSRKMRAYFTAWHELAHLLLYPRRQAVFEGFRRTPTLEAKLKGPRRVCSRSHCRTIGILGATLQTRSPQCGFQQSFS